MQYFGDLSLFDIFVSIVAIWTGCYTVWKSFLQGPRIFLYTGESVTLGHDSNDNSIYMWVSGVAVNKSAKVGVLYPIQVYLKSPVNMELTGKVTQFVDTNSKPANLSPAHALSVPPHSSTPFHLSVRFNYPENNTNIWIDGKYYSRVKGIVDGGGDSAKEPIANFSFEVPDVLTVLQSERDDRFEIACS